jgi:hypothetical protein
MAIVNITCPKCNTNNGMSLLDKHFEGSFNCYRCHEHFLLVMDGGEVTSCTPMTQEEFIRQMELKKQRDRMKG